MRYYAPKRIVAKTVRKWSFTTTGDNMKGCVLQLLEIKNAVTTTEQIYLSKLLESPKLDHIEKTLGGYKEQMRRVISNANVKNASSRYIRNCLIAAYAYTSEKFSPIHVPYADVFMLQPTFHELIKIHDKSWTVRFFQNEALPYWVYVNGRVQYRKKTYVEAHAESQRAAKNAAAISRKTTNTEKLSTENSKTGRFVKRGMGA